METPTYQELKELYADVYDYRHRHDIRDLSYIRDLSFYDDAVGTALFCIEKELLWILTGSGTSDGEFEKEYEHRYNESLTHPRLFTSSVKALFRDIPLEDVFTHINDTLLSPIARWRLRIGK